MNDQEQDKIKENPSETKQPWLFLLSALSGFLAGGVFGFYLAGPSSESKKENDKPPFFTEDKPPLKQSPDIESENQTELQPPSETGEENAPSSLSKNNQESVERYKKMLKKSLETELSKDSPFVWPSYGIAAASFNTQEQASAKAIEIYSQYRDWNVTTRKIKGAYKVIIGSFSDKKSAEDFLKNMKKNTPFKSASIISLAEEKQ